MKSIRSWLLRLAGIFSKQRREGDFADELESHLQMQMEDNLRAGMSQDEARRQAILKLGGVEQTKQAYRERGTMPFVESVLQDLRFALRQLSKNPSFACIAILVLAFGIGAIDAGCGRWCTCPGSVARQLSAGAAGCVGESGRRVASRVARATSLLQKHKQRRLYARL